MTFKAAFFSVICALMAASASIASANDSGLMFSSYGQQKGGKVYLHLKVSSPTKVGGLGLQVFMDFCDKHIQNSFHIHRTRHLALGVESLGFNKAGDFVWTIDSMQASQTKTLTIPFILNQHDRDRFCIDAVVYNAQAAQASGGRILAPQPAQT